MTLHRRAFLKSASASCAAPLIPTYLRADTAVGAGTLTTISDGYLDLPRSFILGDLPETTAAPILERHGLRRRIALRVPQFSTAIAALAGRDLVRQRNVERFWLP